MTEYPKFAKGTSPVAASGGLTVDSAVQDRIANVNDLRPGDTARSKGIVRNLIETMKV